MKPLDLDPLRRLAANLPPDLEGSMKDAQPVLLDLFCGAGGAAMGYHRAGFRVFVGTRLMSAVRRTDYTVEDDE